jgi:2-dehydro-3-deoxygalactonokinase
LATFFVNCDWGTTHFRLRAVRANDVEIAAEFRSDDGAARLAAQAPGSARADDRFRAVLHDGLLKLSGKLQEPLSAAWVLISGMASSSIGWQELPYAKVPLPLDGHGLVWRELEPIAIGTAVHRVVLISGARTDTDVLRGEEIQALGLFQLAAVQATGTPCLVIMPGTHSKHLVVQSGRIEGFRTFMTGELFDVLGRHSILEHSIGSAGGLETRLASESRSAFQAGVEDSVDLALSAALFRVRTRQLLDGHSHESNRAYLSGVLIGSELAYLRQAECSTQRLLLCAAAPLDEYYATALDVLGLSERLTVVEARDLERLSALGQAVLLRKLGRL